MITQRTVARIILNGSIIVAVAAITVGLTLWTAAVAEMNPIARELFAWLALVVIFYAWIWAVIWARDVLGRSHE
jgi:hypothetical protein